MVKFLLWCILFVLCWPLALLALVAYPFIWLMLLPFRLVGIAVGGALALVTALIFLPRSEEHTSELQSHVKLVCRLLLEKKNDVRLLEYLKRVTADLAQTRRRLQEVESGDQEQLAVVAIGCRYPGVVRGPEDLWRLVADV